jgi:hypothetical protein
MSSHYVDVAIGLSYTFLAVSLLCSATREAIASLFQTRAKVLLDGVLTLLHEADTQPRLRGILPSIRRLLRLDGGFGLAKLDAQSLAAQVMRHPLITGLAQRGRMPSYIPSAIFARALVATLVERYGKGESAEALLSRLGNDRLKRTLLAIMGEGPDDLAALEGALRIWYDSVMDRISGWYKRRSQFVLFLIGVFYAAAMNIDALQLSQRLWNDAELRTQLVSKAEGATPPAPAAASASASAAAVTVAARQAAAQASAVQELPIGWPSSRFSGTNGTSRINGASGTNGTSGTNGASGTNGTSGSGGAGAFAAALAFALMGWIVTAFAASLGSPFWFDGIGWLLALRGTGAKPAAESTAAPPALTLPSLRQ